MAHSKVPNASQKFLLFLIVSATVMSQITVAVKGANEFCLMMPPNPAGNVGDTEGSSLAKCTSATLADTVGASVFPAGFITGAHFVSTPLYVQVTGTIDREKFQLSDTDQGGEYDSDPNGSRPGSTCAGYPSYFSYLGPAGNIFCIRCCNPGGDCDSSQDKAGCMTRIPGVYTIGFSSNGEDTAVTNATLTAAKTSTASVSEATTVSVVTPKSTASKENSAASNFSDVLMTTFLLIVLTV